MKGDQRSDPADVTQEARENPQAEVAREDHPERSVAIALKRSCEPTLRPQYQQERRWSWRNEWIPGGQNLPPEPLNRSRFASAKVSEFPAF